MPRCEAGIAAYLRRIQGAHGGWPLFRDGDFDMSATVKAYFALKMIGDEPQAAHMRRAREAIRMRGGAERAQCVHALPAGALRHRAVARGAGDAGRDHAAAEMVSVPPRQDFVLEPHRDRAASGADGEEAARPQCQGRHDRRAISRPAAVARTDAEGAAAEGGRGSGSSAPSTMCCARRSRIFHKRTRQRAIDRAVAWVGERLNGEDGLGAIFPAMANSVMMYRRARLSAGSSAARHRPQIDREAPRRARRRDLLPALRLADLGHRARLPCAPGSRRRARGCRSQARPRLAYADAGARRARRLDRAAARSAARRLGVPIRQSALSRRRRYRRRGDGDGPHARHCATRSAGRRRITAPRSSARASGSSACRAQTAAGARSTPTTNIIISTIFRSPITARCSIRRPRTSPRAACRCWRSSARPKSPAVKRAIDYLRRTQLADGSWYGRWGMNYIYGTWSVLCALNAAGVSSRRAGNAQGGRLARRDPERRRRLGRGRLKL